MTGKCWTFNATRFFAPGVDERQLFDDHVSGSQGDRPGLAKALAFPPAGRLFGCLETGYRLGRSLPHSLATVNGLKSRGIRIPVSLPEQMDTTTPQGEFLAIRNLHTSRGQ